MYNHVELLGRLGDTPTARATSSGKVVAHMRIATNEVLKANLKHTEWHDIEMWEQLAEQCCTYLSKGDKAFVIGHLRTKEWEDEDGNKHRAHYILARDVKFLEGPPKKKGE